MEAGQGTAGNGDEQDREEVVALGGQGVKRLELTTIGAVIVAWAIYQRDDAENGAIMATIMMVVRKSRGVLSVWMGMALARIR